MAAIGTETGTEAEAVAVVAEMIPTAQILAHVLGVVVAAAEEIRKSS